MRATPPIGRSEAALVLAARLLTVITSRSHDEHQTPPNLTLPCQIRVTVLVRDALEKLQVWIYIRNLKSVYTMTLFKILLLLIPWSLQALQGQQCHL
jgi:hypothetical protein